MTIEDAKTLAKRIASRSVIKNPDTEAFNKTGQAAAELISESFQVHLGPLDGKRIIDFGCASGRVLLPLAEAHPNASFCGTDVDREAIQYLRVVAPANVTATVNEYARQLPYEDVEFDGLYAISLWSHFPEDLSRLWLQEVARVVKPGGIAIITVAGSRVLQEWRKTHARWKDVTEDDFERELILYREVANLKDAPNLYPGVTASWGNTLIHERYIRSVWGRDFDVLAFELAGIGRQDIVVMRRP